MIIVVLLCLEKELIIEKDQISSHQRKNTQSVPTSTAGSVYFLYAFVDHKSGLALIVKYIPVSLINKAYV